jgi:uncharacterized Tic20 family protein
LLLLHINSPTDAPYLMQYNHKIVTSTCFGTQEPSSGSVIGHTVFKNITIVVVVLLLGAVCTIQLKYCNSETCEAQHKVYVKYQNSFMSYVIFRVVI